MHKNEIDMLNGPLTKKIVMLALPLAMSSVVQQLFNAADLAVVGRFANPQAMAAVGSNGFPISLFISFFIGLSLGTNVLVAGLIGKGQREDISSAVHSSVTLAMICGVTVMCLGMLLARPLLTLVGSPVEIRDQAVLYMRIYMIGAPCILFYNFGAAILRSKGDSRRPLFTMLKSGVLNVCLNVILVAVFHLDVAGVAIATVASNVFAAGTIFRILRREEEQFRLHLNKLRIRLNDLKTIVRIGFPAGLQGMVFSIANVTIQSSVNSFGEIVIAGNSAAQYFDSIDFHIVQAFAQSAVTFTSQNYSAGKYDRCRQIYRITTLVSLGVSFTFCMLCGLFRWQLAAIFTTDETVKQYIVLRILLTVCPHFLINSYEISAGCLRGMGISLTPAIITVIGTCVVRLSWVFLVVSRYHDYKVLMLCYPVSWVITGTAMTILYLLARKKKLDPSLLLNI